METRGGFNMAAIAGADEAQVGWREEVLEQLESLKYCNRPSNEYVNTSLKYCNRPSNEYVNTSLKYCNRPSNEYVRLSTYMTYMAHMARVNYMNYMAYMT